MSHYTMHAAINYAALPPTSPLQLPLPYLPPPPPPRLSLPPLLPPPPPAAVAAASSDAGFQSRISPSVLLIILILAVIFFVSGLLHLLIRFLLRPAPRDAGDAYGGDANATAFQGQLQQLFHLHDAGVDQSFIDALPVFLYGAVVGASRKDPFDCAVCLCEFTDDDRLHLLPKWVAVHLPSTGRRSAPYPGSCSPGIGDSPGRRQRPPLSQGDEEHSALYEMLFVCIVHGLQMVMPRPLLQYPCLRLLCHLPRLQFLSMFTDG